MRRGTERANKCSARPPVRQVPMRLSSGQQLLCICPSFFHGISYFYPSTSSVTGHGRCTREGQQVYFLYRISILPLLFALLYVQHAACINVAVSQLTAFLAAIVYIYMYIVHSLESSFGVTSGYNTNRIPTKTPVSFHQPPLTAAEKEVG
jgi:hypothetical protein